jgi:serine acetyltransferase
VWIGANAVVLADVPDDGVVGGVWRGTEVVATS